MIDKIVIYTDGACRGNPGPGGWGAIIIENNIETELYGKEDNTTNNIMEMTAAIKALEFFSIKKNIILYTDSNYLKLGITSWIYGWKKNNWLNSKKEKVKNKCIQSQIPIDDKRVQTVFSHILKSRDQCIHIF